MRYGLNGLHDAPVLREVRARRFDLLRVGWLHEDDPDAVVILTGIQEVVGPPLVIVRNGAQVRSFGAQLSGADCELWNEPDGSIDGYFSPIAYAELVPDFLAACAEVGAQPWIGAIGNFTLKSFGWLTEMLAALPAGLPLFGVTAHYYLHGQHWNVPHPGFYNRVHEVDTFRALIGVHRRWAISEFGYWTTNQRKRAWLPFWWPGNRFRWTDTDVAQMVARDWDFWKEQGAEFCCLYQLNDGPTNVKENRFGIRRVDGTWKPSADTVPPGN